MPVSDEFLRVGISLQAVFLVVTLVLLIYNKVTKPKRN